MHGFVLDKGEYTVVNYPGGTSTNLYAINPARRDPGRRYSNGIFTSFLWEKGTYTIIDVPFGTQTAATGINARGAIVGSYVDPEQTAGVESALRGYLLRF